MRVGTGLSIGLVGLGLASPALATAPEEPDGAAVAKDQPSVPSRPAEAVGGGRPERRVAVAVTYAQRFRGASNDAPTSEISAPHGLTDFGNQAAFLVDIGMLLPHIDGQPTLFSSQALLEFEPTRAIVSPFLNVGAGGYLVAGRGRGRSAANQVEWLWGSSASLGAKLRFEKWTLLPLSLRAAARAFWVEQPQVPIEIVYSGWSVGVGLEYEIGVPNIHAIRRVTHGDGMPEGW